MPVRSTAFGKAWEGDTKRINQTTLKCSSILLAILRTKRTKLKSGVDCVALYNRHIAAPTNTCMREFQSAFFCASDIPRLPILNQTGTCWTLKRLTRLNVGIWATAQLHLSSARQPLLECLHYSNDWIGAASCDSNLLEQFSLSRLKFTWIHSREDPHGDVLRFVSVEHH